MQIINFPGMRVVVPSTQSYEQVVTALESMLGRSDDALIAQMAQQHASVEQVMQAVKGMVGTSGLMIVARIEQGLLLSLLGKPKKAVLYVLANPLVANTMFDHNTAIALYVPVRMAVYEDEHGSVSVAYDKPSSLLGQFEDEQIAETAHMIDQKLEELATTAAGTNMNNQ